ncbi:alpha/beta-hydrolase [Polychaeton citri CBS 116435]|uniref:Alpha/beta-hydrolase n=1 Tax=Polychaeton citri CBS 116435 TaxID=1314669 RepID=A0A9P4UUA7_9PEZI|nr:alpha/beta-hydrolase [Polychaeton citri CBS 116435]
MRFLSTPLVFLLCRLLHHPAGASPTPPRSPLKDQAVFTPADHQDAYDENGHNSSARQVSLALYTELEELARLVDITYCVSDTTGPGISEPFTCPSRCAEFPSLRLVTTFSTGALLSDSCGYIAVDHDRARLIVAFRGSYSLSNAIVDLSTIPQKYEPYQPPDDAGSSNVRTTRASDCKNCTVHTGFQKSWQNTRPYILDNLNTQLSLHPTYSVTLLGHSLGGAVAALAGLDLFSSLANATANAVDLTVTTFGEPRIGNAEFSHYLDDRFSLLPDSPSTTLTSSGDIRQKYRRITRLNDPVPLLPLTEWGYTGHGGEIFISSSLLPPPIAEVLHCVGDNDINCIAGQDSSIAASNEVRKRSATTRRSSGEDIITPMKREIEDVLAEPWGIPSRYKLWELFFAHRDYFWRLGLCMPGGDPFGGGKWRGGWKLDL